MDRSFGEYGYGLIMAYLIGAIVESFFYDLTNNHWWGGLLWLAMSFIIFFIWIFFARRRDRKNHEEYMKKFMAQLTDKDHEAYQAFLRKCKND
jgi:hypothetical protein